MGYYAGKRRSDAWWMDGGANDEEIEGVEGFAKVRARVQQEPTGDHLRRARARRRTVARVRVEVGRSDGLSP